MRLPLAEVTFFATERLQRCAKCGKATNVYAELECRDGIRRLCTSCACQYFTAMGKAALGRLLKMEDQAASAESHAK